jgi:hypothetical protein
MLDITKDLRFISGIQNLYKRNYAFKYRAYLWGQIPQPNYETFKISKESAQYIRVELRRLIINEREEVSYEEG